MDDFWNFLKGQLAEARSHGFVHISKCLYIPIFKVRVQGHYNLMEFELEIEPHSVSVKLEQFSPIMKKEL